MDLSSVARRILPTHCVVDPVPRLATGRGTRCRWFVGEFSPDARRMRVTMGVRFFYSSCSQRSTISVAATPSMRSTAEDGGASSAIATEMVRPGRPRAMRAIRSSVSESIGLSTRTAWATMPGVVAMGGGLWPSLWTSWRVGFCGMEAPRTGGGTSLASSGRRHWLCFQPGAFGLRPSRITPRER